MKKTVCILLSVALSLIFFGCNAQTTTEPDYALIRIHIRANSNQSCDQQVKMQVKESVTELLSSRLTVLNDFAAAYAAVSSALDDVERVAKKTLESNGFSYGARARLCEEYFPTRAYENVIVESGYYDALIVELGDGAGDNWWCVIYPPLCFVGRDDSSGFRYASLIKELWKKFTTKAEEKCVYSRREKGVYA